MNFTEDTLVQQTTAEYLEQQFGWESVYAFNESPAKSPFLQALFKVQRSKFNVFNRLDDNNFVKNDNLDFLQLNL
jgi:hypothetical protein